MSLNAMADPRGLCNRWGTFAALALLPSLLEAQASPPPPLARVAFTGVSVVNPETGAIEPDQTVVVADGRIVRVGRGNRSLPPGIVPVPARGQFLIPGLWDMHVHLAVVTLVPAGDGPPDFSANADWQFPLLLAAGVTGVRDMSGDFNQLRSWRNEITAGLRAGPRMVHTGRKLGGDGPVLPGGPAAVRTVADVERSVDMLAKAGAGFVKVESMSAEHLAAAISAAKRHGLPAVGHLGPWISAREASELGITGIEHLHQVLEGGSAEEASFLAEARHESSWWGKLLVRVGWWDLTARRRSRIERSVATWDSVKAKQLFAVLARNATWQTPTLTGLRDVQRIQPAIPDERLQWLPPRMIRREASRVHVEPADVLAYRLLYRLQQQVLPMLARAGVPMLAGSDAPGTRRVPGQSLIEELETMVNAGLTPLDALRSATLNPARFLGLADSLGSVAPGKLADLVLLEGNPLTDITALRRVQGVVAGGRYYSRADLDRRLGEVQALLGRLRAGERESAETLAPPGSGGAR
jgi:imidazolonepropionase-like amidohydrolase